MKHGFWVWSATRLHVAWLNSLRAYIVIHKIHLMNLKNAATLVPDASP
jgi:hypothetical protein